jgi:hypothetical protein
MANGERRKSRHVTKTPKALKVASAAAAPPKARHPHGRVEEPQLEGSAFRARVRDRAAKRIMTPETRLSASNAQLLRLSRVTATVKQKYGNREKLIAAIGTAEKKAKDKDFIAKLESFSLPQLLDMASSAERRARA